MWGRHSPCWSLGMNLRSWLPRLGLMMAVAQEHRRREEERESVVLGESELREKLVRGFVGWESRSSRSRKMVSGCWSLTDMREYIPLGIIDHTLSRRDIMVLSRSGHSEL